MVVGSFGKRLVFQVSPAKVFTPSSIKREYKTSYEEHKVLGAKPRLEFLAPELVTFSLSITLSASFGVHPALQLIRIQECVEYGYVDRLILGGMNHHFHVIESAAEDWRHVFPDGLLMSAGVTLNFREYIK